MTSLAPTYDFRGNPVRRLQYRGELAFIGREVGAALGYPDGGKRFVSQLTADWSTEIREGTHWFRVKGEDLQQIKGQMPGAPRSLLFANELVLLTKQGLSSALFRSGRPLAQEMWSWLVDEVVPLRPEPRQNLESFPVRRFSHRGAPAFIAREVGAALGYEHAGKRFVSHLTGEWAGQIREGVHWFRVKGADLRKLKTQLGAQAAPSCPPLRPAAIQPGARPAPSDPPPFRAPEIVVLTEAGLRLVLLRSDRPAALEFRSLLSGTSSDVASAEADIETLLFGLRAVAAWKGVPLPATRADVLSLLRQAAPGAPR